MIARIRRLSLAALFTLVGTVIGTPLAAQQIVPAAPAPPAAVAVTAAQAAPAGPTIERAAAGARSHSQRAATLDDAEAAMQQRLGLGQARALMIVGFSALVIGLLMDNDPGTLIAVGGAVVGLYGLYHYLR